MTKDHGVLVAEGFLLKLLEGLPEIGIFHSPVTNGTEPPLPMWDYSRNEMRFMQKIRLALYGVLTVAGIGWPWLCIYRFIGETEALGLTDPIDIVNLFSSGVWANASAGFIAADLTLVLIASFIFYAAEGMRVGMKRWYLYIPATFAISFAFSFGLFMFNRERLINQSTPALKDA